MMKLASYKALVLQGRVYIKYMKFYLWIFCYNFTGLLLAKKKLFKNPVPDGAGGGTVLFVSINTSLYYSVLLFNCIRYNKWIAQK